MIHLDKYNAKVFISGRAIGWLHKSGCGSFAIVLGRQRSTEFDASAAGIAMADFGDASNITSVTFLMVRCKQPKLKGF